MKELTKKKISQVSKCDRCKNDIKGNGVELIFMFWNKRVESDNSITNLPDESVEFTICEECKIKRDRLGL